MSECKSTSSAPFGTGPRAAGFLNSFVELCCPLPVIFVTTFVGLINVKYKYRPSIKV